MDALIGLLALLAPALVGILTVPIFDGLKTLLGLRSKLPAWSQQLMVPLAAYGLTWLSGLLDVILPATLDLITVDHTSALIAAAIALAVKAGKQAKLAAS